ncbi:hypothetical protein [Pseudobutyrivibrio ruminis]|uniref:hypothetical protein n=1 Tax=Pseudobutyrivibrio ruminis TaxID=46206 RepID=UPI00051B6B97|nr:hypothetical protein [Pseudobutyrivibrio ruminis]
MRDNSGFGGNSLFDSNHDGHIDAFEADQAECFLHDCDTYDQIAFKSSGSDGDKSTTRYSNSLKVERIHDKEVVNMAFLKQLGIVVASIVAGIIAILVIWKIIDAPYAAYEKSLARLQGSIQNIDYDKYVAQNDWLFSISTTRAEFESDKYKYDAGEEVTQNNSVYVDGVYDVGFEKQSSKAQALLMCSMCNQVIQEAEDIYHNSDYYEKYGKLLEAGETVPFRKDVTIVGYETEYRLQVGTLDGDYFLTMRSNGEGNFVSKTYINDQEYYYKYDLRYTDGELTTFKLQSYDTPYGYGYFFDDGELISHTKSNSNSSSNDASSYSNNSYSNRDSYNSGRYKDADSFAEDYYEEFYDYDDYEDDEDAYDEAVDYWNDWND